MRAEGERAPAVTGASQAHLGMQACIVGLPIDEALGSWPLQAVAEAKADIRFPRDQPTRADGWDDGGRDASLSR